MSCYHPMVGFPTKDYTPDHKLYSFQSIDPVFAREKDPRCVVVPCGHCIGCRLDYSRAWADRMMLELETAKKAIFVTLTYDNDHVPIMEDEDTGELIGFTLDKRDAQLFMKNLRRDYDGKDGHPLAKIRYYLSGEYGDTTERPHMHAIIFGLCLDDFPLKVPRGKNELGQQFFEVPELRAAWPNGFVLVSDVTWETCAYVSRYVMKKALKDGLSAYERGLEKEFVLMSRRPGIGREYLEQHPDCLDQQSINISTPKGGRKLSIPKYYLKQLELTDPEKCAKMKEARKTMAIDSMLMKLNGTSLSILEQLEQEEDKKLRSIQALKRSKI